MPSRFPSLSRKDFARVMERVLSDHSVRAAWAVVGDGKAVIRAVRRLKMDGRCSRGELLVTYGQPNYRQRMKIKAYAKRGESLPRMFAEYWPPEVRAGAGSGATRAKRARAGEVARKRWTKDGAKGKPGTVACLGLTALDTLAEALAGNGHRWTAKQRRAYERATAALRPLMEEPPAALREPGDRTVNGRRPKREAKG